LADSDAVFSQVVNNRLHIQHIEPDMMNTGAMLGYKVRPHAFPFEGLDEFKLDRP
jgi:hypothetical protein